MNMAVTPSLRALLVQMRGMRKKKDKKKRVMGRFIFKKKVTNGVIGYTVRDTGGC